MKIIHFVTDEKFIDDMISSFETILPGVSSYYLISKEDNYRQKLIKSEKITIINNCVSVFIKEMEADIVIIHNLAAIPYKYISLIPNSIKVVWFSWGFDIYSNRRPQLKLVKINNRIKFNSLPFKVYMKKRIVDLFDTIIYHKNNLLHYGYTEEKDFKKAIHRIDYYSGVFPLEYDMVSKNDYFRAKQVYFNYPSKEGTFDLKEVFRVPAVGDDIQIGQSASPLINHVSTLKILHKAKIKGRKIIVPLSYQKEDWYVDYVTKIGRKLCGEDFLPLVDFMPYEEYLETVKNVGIAIFYVMQQSAVGNILLALWNGAKVFLPKDSMNYKHFCAMGFKVYKIEDITISMIETKLTPSEIISNRKRLAELYSFERNTEKIKELVDTIVNYI